MGEVVDAIGDDRVFATFTNSETKEFHCDRWRYISSSRAVQLSTKIESATYTTIIPLDNLKSITLPDHREGT